MFAHMELLNRAAVPSVILAGGVASQRRRSVPASSREWLPDVQVPEGAREEGGKRGCCTVGLLQIKASVMNVGIFFVGAARARIKLDWLEARGTSAEAALCDAACA